jgi:hypothetical protein
VYGISTSVTFSTIRNLAFCAFIRFTHTHGRLTYSWTSGITDNVIKHIVLRSLTATSEQTRRLQSQELCPGPRQPVYLLFAQPRFAFDRAVWFLCLLRGSADRTNTMQRSTDERKTYARRTANHYDALIRGNLSRKNGYSVVYRTRALPE